MADSLSDSITTAFTIYAVPRENTGNPPGIRVRCNTCQHDTTYNTTRMKSHHELCKATDTANSGPPANQSGYVSGVRLFQLPLGTPTPSLPFSSPLAENQDGEVQLAIRRETSSENTVTSSPQPPPQPETPSLANVIQDLLERVLCYHSDRFYQFRHFRQELLDSWFKFHEQFVGWKEECNSLIMGLRSEGRHQEADDAYRRLFSHPIVAEPGRFIVAYPTGHGEEIFEFKGITQNVSPVNHTDGSILPRPLEAHDVPTSRAGKSMRKSKLFCSRCRSLSLTCTRERSSCSRCVESKARCFYADSPEHKQRLDKYYALLTGELKKACGNAGLSNKGGKPAMAHRLAQNEGEKGRKDTRMNRTKTNNKGRGRPPKVVMQ
ncbi:hypothetical protein F5Y08DRAFT_306342 [Xylaria arbuscula]|nr:hypothetical protein F5Y08DRAFT_306342 [Xylaria arbuscula]